MNEYPEHEKLHLVRDESQLIGEFLEWLFEKHSICRWQDAGNNGKPRKIPATEEDLERIAELDGKYSWEWSTAKQLGIDNPDYEWWSEGYEPVHRSVHSWLAEFFEIDEKKLDDEKRAMLEALRAAQ